MSNDLLSFNKSVRRSAMIYLVLAAGVISAVLALSIDPALHCKENTCPGWLRGIFGSFGALVALGALTSLVKKSEWGSRVDRNERRLIWWVGPPPRQEKSIDIDRISVVRVETKWDSHKLIIRERLAVVSP